MSYRPFHLHLLIALLLCSAAIGCKVKSLPPNAGTGGTMVCENGGTTLDPADETPPTVECPDKEEPVLCYGQWAAHCHNGQLGELTNCNSTKEVCAPGKCAGGKCGGCMKCQPNSTLCGSNGKRSSCKADGSGYVAAANCNESAGEHCSQTDNKCEDLCAAAVKAHSYVGCEYWAVPTLNSELEYDLTDAEGLCQPFPFAVVIANTESVTATVRIQSGSTLRTVKVPPSSVKTVELPCNAELKGDSHKALDSVQVAGGAQHIVSDVPVTVYQFNPLHFQSDVPGVGNAYSYTNDASLLLPVSSLTGNYRVMTRPTYMQWIDRADKPGTIVKHVLPAFVAVVGVQATPTDVEIISSAHTRASADGKIPALSPGQTLHVTLAQGEVLQLTSDAPDTCDGNSTTQSYVGVRHYCHVPSSYDFTGTQIRAAGPVSVLSGNDCTFVPYDKWACDHLEETMFPQESWGKDIFMTVSAPIDCGTDVPNVFRILSGADDNHISFVPAVHAPVTLARGQYVEFMTTDSFEVAGSKSLMAGQFMVGQDWDGSQGEMGSYTKGDPSMSLGIPVEQWRNRYSFLTPDTYTDNFVNIVAGKQQVVTLDGRVVAGFTPIKGTSMGLARVQVDAGPHVVSSGGLFAIIVYGYATYTSYMLPGGLDLHAISTPE